MGLLRAAFQESIKIHGVPSLWDAYDKFEYELSAVTAKKLIEDITDTHTHAVAIFNERSKKWRGFYTDYKSYDEEAQKTRERQEQEDDADAQKAVNPLSRRKRALRALEKGQDLAQTFQERGQEESAALLAKWLQVINYEISNPENLMGETLKQRVRHAFTKVSVDWLL